MYSTVENAAKMVVGNKVDLVIEFCFSLWYGPGVFDQESNREVQRDEGIQFAKDNGCLFVETSAKVNVAVTQAFEELACKIMETPSLVSEGQSGIKLGLPDAKSESSGLCC